MIYGECIETGFSESYGNYVHIKISNSSYISYNHLNKVLIKKGDIVDIGHPIALSGNTGNSTAPHLHLELYTNDISQNMLGFLNFDYTKNFANEFKYRGEPFLYENKDK